MQRCLILFALAGLAVAPATWGQQVVQARGVDSRVDYAALKALGPWDDRNYGLDQEDLALLAPNEREQRDPIPAFYRVELRRQRPELRRSGPAQYPRSAYNFFLLQYGGYLIDGRLYEEVTAGADGRWTVDLAAPSEPAPTGFELGERVIGGEVRITNPTGAAESAIAINPLDTDKLIAGSNGPGSGQKMHWSTDGGATWHQVSLPLGGTCCDPTVDWSADGTKAYTATLGSGVWLYRSGDGGQTWNDLETQTPGDPRRELSSGSDKEYIHVDKFASSPFKDNLYVTWHDGNVMKFSRSTDQANTFSSIVSLSSGSAESGIGSDMVTDRSGNLYYFWPAFNSQRILVRKSTDGGATFAATQQVATTEASFDFPIPVFETRRAFIYIAADADLSNGPFADSIYAAWLDTIDPEDDNIATNNHSRIVVAYSHDGGATWQQSIPHETVDGNTVDRFNHWLSVSPDGTVHVMFYDTRQDLPNRNKADIYHSFSTDGAVTWSTPQRLTTVSSPNITGGFEWGDYNGMSASLNDLMAIYTDNRDETGGTAQSIDVYGIGFKNALPLFTDGFESGDVSAWSLCSGTGCPP